MLLLPTYTSFFAFTLTSLILSVGYRAMGDMAPAGLLPHSDPAAHTNFNS